MVRSLILYLFLLLFLRLHYMCKETEKFQNEIADVLFDGKQLLATEAERRLEKNAITK